MIRAVVLATTTKPAMRQLSTSCLCLAGKAWRESQGLSRSGNEYGPLTDLPDWSYADGRPAPPRPLQLKRKEEQRKLAERIDILSHEMLEAKRKHQHNLEAAAREDELKTERRLKPKGSSWRQKGYVDRRSRSKSESGTPS